MNALTVFPVGESCVVTMDELGVATERSLMVESADVETGFVDTVVRGVFS